MMGDGSDSGNRLVRQRKLIAGAREQAARAAAEAGVAGPGSSVASEFPGSAAAHGQMLPGYKILREIHRGGQGVVFLAVQQSTGRQVAVKVMKEGPFAGPSD